MDLYRDFAYCMVTGHVDATSTSVPVDELGRLPSNAELAVGEFWMTFESTYALDQFEIVRLVSKGAETGAGVLTVLRGQHGSTAYARSPGAFLKHAVTAEMLDDLVNLTSTRLSTSFTSVVLPAGTGLAGGEVPLAAGYRLYTIQTDRPARVRLYTSVDKRTADAPRLIGTDPAEDAGVMIDYVTSSTAVMTLSPLVDGYVAAGTDAPVTIDNRDTVDATVTVTFTYVRTE